MAESSDGEPSDDDKKAELNGTNSVKFNNTKRRFENLENEEHISEVIKESVAFMKFCYNLSKGWGPSACINDMNIECASDEFKKQLNIPSKTDIVINGNMINNKISAVQLAFNYKTNKSDKKKKVIIPLSILGVETAYSKYTKKFNIIESSDSDATEQTDAILSANKANASKNMQIPNGIFPPDHHSTDASTIQSDTTTNEFSDVSEINEMAFNEQNFTKIKTLLLKCVNENKSLHTVQNDLTKKIGDLEAKLNELLQQNTNKSPARKRAQRTENVSQLKLQNVKNNLSMDIDDTDLTYTDNSQINSNNATHKNSENNATTSQLNDMNETTTNTQSAARTSGNATHKLNRRVPPIVVLDNNQKRMQERIETTLNCNKNDFYFTRVNKSKYRIFLNSLEHYDKLINYLKELDIRFHTYTPPERKSIHVIIKHVPNCYDENEIRLSLNETYGLKPTKLTKYMTGYMREKNIESSMWHAQFDPQTDKKIIFSIKCIGNQKGISVENILNRNITQCTQCWRYEHTKTNCSYMRRCYRCDEQHDEGKCKLDDNPSLKPWCVNCHSDTHNAISKECEIYKKILERKKNSKSNNENNKRNTNVPAPTTAGTSYANTIKKNSNQTVQNTNSLTPILNTMKQMMQHQQQMMNEFTKFIENNVSNGK